jgi:acyl-CoA synthetase (AMP-forming)/AMP-acid ligase II
MFRPPIRPDASEAVALPFDTILDLLPADDAPAIIGTEGRRPLTFSRLISQSRGLNLSKFGIGPTDRVAVAIPNGPEAASALLAFTYACAYAPLNPRLTHAELAFELEDLPAKAVVVQRGERELNNGRIIEVARAMRLSILELVPSTAEAGAWELHSLDASTPMPRGAHLWHSHKPVQAGGAAASILEPATCAGVPVRSAARVAPVANAETEEGHDETEAANVETESANDVTRAANDKSGATLHRPGDCSRTRRGAVCLLLHTSGTSSKPKLVPLTHQNLGVGASCIAAALQLTRGETSLSIMPLFHIHGEWVAGK